MQHRLGRARAPGATPPIPLPLPHPPVTAGRYSCYYLTRNSLTYTAPVMVSDPALKMDITQARARGCSLGGPPQSGLLSPASSARPRSVCVSPKRRGNQVVGVCVCGSMQHAVLERAPW